MVSEGGVYAQSSENMVPHERKVGIGLLAVLTLVSAIAPLSIDTYLPALPSVAVEFGSPPAAVQLTLTAFLFGLAIGQLVLGPLSDRVGRRRPLIAGITVCVVASLGCALAPGIELLVAARFLQGAAGAAGVVIARAVVADRAHGTAAARVFAVMASVQGLAPVLAPLAGALLAPVVGWRGIFGVLSAVTAAMAIGAVLLVRESLPPPARRPESVPVLARSLLVVARDRAFLAPALAFSCAFGALFGYIAASPFVVQNLLGLSVGWFSLTFAANAAGLALSSALSAQLVARLGPTRLLTAGLVLLLSCTLALVIVTAALSLRTGPGRVLVLVLLLGASIAIGQVFGNATSLALAAARHRAGAGSAVLGALQFAVGGLASPLVGLGEANTALPMALTMTAFATLACAALLCSPHQ